jgi:hypothetical protein
MSIFAILVRLTIHRLSGESWPFITAQLFNIST